MDFTLTEEQVMVRDTAHALLARHCPTSLVRAHMDDPAAADDSDAPRERGSARDAGGAEGGGQLFHGAYPGCVGASKRGGGTRWQRYGCHAQVQGRRRGSTLVGCAGG